MGSCKGCAYLEKGEDGKWYCGDCGIAVDDIPKNWCSANGELEFEYLKNS